MLSLVAGRRADLNVPSQAFFLLPERIVINLKLSFGSKKKSAGRPVALLELDSIIFKFWFCLVLAMPLASAPFREKHLLQVNQISTEKENKRSRRKTEKFKQNRPLRYLKKISTPEKGVVFFLNSVSY